ncbi:hypothetical protein SRABI04_01479 [Chryseobacterium sp. Bi04]|nr:hypothetical protein SRABI04_01479 [Chryseobacterium sp. Bi04]
MKIEVEVTIIKAAVMAIIDSEEKEVKIITSFFYVQTTNKYSPFLLIDIKIWIF